MKRIFVLFLLCSYLVLISSVHANTLLFEDNFTRVNSGTIGNGWLDLNSQWSISNNAAFTNAQSETLSMLVVNRSAVDVMNVTVSYNTTLAKGYGTYLWLRVKNTTTLYDSYSGVVIFLANGSFFPGSTERIIAIQTYNNTIGGPFWLFNATNEVNVNTFTLNISYVGNNITVQMYNGSTFNQKLAEVGMLLSNFSYSGGVAFSQYQPAPVVGASFDTVRITTANVSSPPPPVQNDTVSVVFPPQQNIVKQRNTTTFQANMPFVFSGNANQNFTLTFRGVTYNLTMNSSNALAFTANNTPTGCYNASVVALNNSATITNYCAGEVIFSSGQSNLKLNGTNGIGTPLPGWNYSNVEFNWTTNQIVSMYSLSDGSSYTYYKDYANPQNISTWIDMEAVPLVYGIANTYNTPVMYLSLGASGTTISQHLNNTAISNLSKTIVSQATYNGDIRFAFWMQGEGDSATASSTYYSNLQSLRTNYFSSWNIYYPKLLLIPIGSYELTMGDPTCTAGTDLRNPVIADLYAITQNSSLFELGATVYDVATNSNDCVHMSYLNVSNQYSSAYPYTYRMFDTFRRIVYEGSYTNRPTIQSVQRFNDTVVRVYWDRNIKLIAFDNTTTKEPYAIDLYSSPVTPSNVIGPGVNYSSIVNVSASGNLVQVQYNTNISGLPYAGYGFYPLSVYNRSIAYDATVEYPFSPAPYTLSMLVTNVSGNSYIQLTNGTISPASGYTYIPNILTNFSIATIYNTSSDTVSQARLFINSTVYNASTLDNTIFTVSNILLKAGAYNYYWNVTLNTGSSNVTTTLNYSVLVASPTLSIGFNPSANVYNNTAVTVTGSNCPSQITCILFNDTTNVSNPFTQAYNSTGQFNFTYNTTGNENYSAATILSALTVSEYIPPTPTNSTAAAGVTRTTDTVFYAFALISLLTIVGAAFALITLLSKDLDPNTLMLVAISIIGLAVVLFIGYVVIGNVETSVLTVLQ